MGMSKRMPPTMEVDCPFCGGWGELYPDNAPDPVGPCLRCGGKWIASPGRWTKGSGMQVVTVRA